MPLNPTPLHPVPPLVDARALHRDLAYGPLMTPVFATWLFFGAICAPLVGWKAHRMGQPVFPWAVAGMAFSLITLAVIQYYEPTKAEREAAKRKGLL